MKAQLDSMYIENMHAVIYKQGACHKTVDKSNEKALSTESSGTKWRYAASQRKLPLKYLYCKRQDTKIADCHKRTRNDQWEVDNKKKTNSHALSFGEFKESSPMWLVDSDLSYHIWSDLKLFTSVWERTVIIDTSIRDNSIITGNFEVYVDLILCTAAYGKYWLRL